LPLREAIIQEDPHALKLYVDGNSYKNPGGAGGFACVARYPDAFNLPDESLVFSEGYQESSINRMELSTCIRAFEWIAQKGRALGFQRVQLFTDSLYVSEHHRNATAWRKQKWRTQVGRPIENSDLWKRFIAAWSKVSVRVDILWVKGKKSSILKTVDRAAKAAGKSPYMTDRGFRGGKVGKSKVRGGTSSPFPASGQLVTIHIYRSRLVGKRDHVVYFDVFDPVRGEFTSKGRAYPLETLIAHLHRHHCYRVRFNAEPMYPQIVEIVAESPCEKPATTADDKDDPRDCEGSLRDGDSTTGSTRREGLPAQHLRGDQRSPSVPRNYDVERWRL
jgi:ribonuclease HI